MAAPLRNRPSQHHVDVRNLLCRIHALCQLLQAPRERGPELLHLVRVEDHLAGLGELGAWRGCGGLCEEG